MSFGGLDFLVGSVNGLLKGIQLSENASNSVSRNINSVKDEDKVEVTCLAPGLTKETLLMGGADGTVKTLKLSSKPDLSIETLLTSSPGEGHKLKGLMVLDNKIVTASSSGVVSLFDDAISLEDEAAEPLASFDVIKQSLKQSGRLKKGSYATGSAEEIEHVARLREGRDLSCLVASPHQVNVAATAGKENDLQLWDLNRAFDSTTQKKSGGGDDDGCVFRAKNVCHDKLELRVPIWVSGIAFSPPGASDTDKKVSCVSKHGHIRLYDTRCGQRRPVMATQWQDEAPVSVAALDDHKLVVGSGTGKLALVDWNAKPSKSEGLIVQKYKGCVGSVRSIKVAPASSGKYFVTAGLDRYLRIFDVTNPKPVHRMYMKSKLNCLLVSPDFDPSGAVVEMRKDLEAAARAKAKKAQEAGNVIEKAKEGEGQENEIKDDEMFWKKLKIIREKPKKRKNPAQGGPPEASKRINR